MINYKQITEFGLDEKEAKVFLASLELGGENVLTIANKAGINRVATYEALESLIKKGLVSTFIKGKRTNYTATNPERLRYLLEQEKNTIAKKEEMFSKLLPELKSIFNFTTDKPKVTYYEGKEGVKTIQADFLKTPDKIARAIFFYDILPSVFTVKEMKEYAQKRIKAGIQIKSIAVIKDRKLEISPADENVDRGYIDFHKFPMESDITIYHDKIALVSLSQLFGIIIENKELAATMRSFFDLALSIAAKNPAKI